MAIIFEDKTIKGGCHRGAEFSKVTAEGKKLLLNLLDLERRLL